MDSSHDSSIQINKSVLHNIERGSNLPHCLFPLGVIESLL